jgi:RNA polymerase sigma-70 factor (ECF subfamily)
MMTTTFVRDDDKISVVRLVTAAQNGDREAFGRLFDRFEGHVFAIAMKRLGDFCEAQELCQDVFVQALQKIDQLRKPECFGGWLRSIAKRMAINRAVRRSPDIAAEPATLAAVCVDPQNPLREMLAAERQAQVRAGLDRLGDLDRATLVAFYVEGRSLLEMSDDFDAPLGTIKRRLHVARKRLAKEVEPIMAV